MMFQNTENRQDFEVITVGLAIFRNFPRTHKNAARSYRAEHTHNFGGSKAVSTFEKQTVSRNRPKDVGDSDLSFL